MEEHYNSEKKTIVSPERKSVKTVSGGLIPNHLAVSGDKSEVSSIQRAHFRKNGVFSSILTEVGMD